MSAASDDRTVTRGSRLLIAHCHVLGGFDERATVVDRLQGLIGPELTRLLLVALAGDHRMRSHDLTA